MKLARLVLLCLLSVLLPLGGYANASAPGCAARSAATAPAATTMPATTHAHHAGMLMTMDMTMSGMPAHGSVTDADHTRCHDGCQCAAHCALGGAALSMAGAATSGRSPLRDEQPQPPLARNTRPARVLDLLRPPNSANV